MSHLFANHIESIKEEIFVCCDGYDWMPLQALICAFEMETTGWVRG